QPTQTYSLPPQTRRFYSLLRTCQVVCSTLAASRRSQLMMVEWDLPNERPVALTPNPSLRTLRAAATTWDDVLSLAIGVLVRSLNRLSHSRHR
ncbi:MAG: hypothetical protein AAFW75_19400, partial [Cyanobacteria bacterium J06636_16]